MFLNDNNSFNGEEWEEFNLKGGKEVVEKMIEVLGEMKGWRIEEDGEFKRSDFENGKMELKIEEGMEEIIDEEKEGKRRIEMKVD